MVTCSWSRMTASGAAARSAPPRETTGAWSNLPLGSGLWRRRRPTERLDLRAPFRLPRPHVCKVSGHERTGQVSRNFQSETAALLIDKRTSNSAPTASAKHLRRLHYHRRGKSLSLASKLGRSRHQYLRRLRRHGVVAGVVVR